MRSCFFALYSNVLILFSILVITFGAVLKEITNNIKESRFSKGGKPVHIVLMKKFTGVVNTKMPRTSRKPGIKGKKNSSKAKGKRGISSELVCVVCAKDRVGNIIAELNCKEKHIIHI